jgi:hypothetical protein
MQIDQEILTAMAKLLTITGDPFVYYRIGAVKLRMGDRIGAASSYKSAWEKAPRTAHYRDAAKKLASTLSSQKK